jgi:aspartate/methionine/tyrosine aminotransferase
VIITLPDNPTGTLARPATIRRLCEVAARHDLIIISDEIYRDLVHDPAAPVSQPGHGRAGRTVVTTALSKSMAVGGWRIRVARLPDGPLVPRCATGCSASEARSGPRPQGQSSRRRPMPSTSPGYF